MMRDNVRQYLREIGRYPLLSAEEEQVIGKAIKENPVWFSNALTHPHDKPGGFQFIQRTLDRHGAAGQDCGNGCDREAEDVYKRQVLHLQSAPSQGRNTLHLIQSRYNGGQGFLLQILWCRFQKTGL